MASANSGFVPHLDVVLPSRIEPEKWRLRRIRPLAKPGLRGDAGALEGVHRFIVITDVKVGRVIGGQEELVNARSGRSDVAPQSSAVVVHRVLRAFQQANIARARGRKSQRNVGDG